MSAADGAGARPRTRKTLERQRRILDMVTERGSCSAQELATAFGVSIMTVHRDLDELERRGAVRKFHGGVTAQPSAVFESRMSFRMSANSAAKQALARQALTHVEPGSIVLLDDSSTVLPMVPSLGELAPLHVATTCLTAMKQLSELADSGVHLLGLGGDYDHMHDSFVGLRCIEQIEGIRADVCFLSTSAVSTQYAFHQEERIVAVKRAMMRVATRRILLVDNSKLGRNALYQMCPLSAFDTVIVDSGASQRVLDELRDAGVRVEVASLLTAVDNADDGPEPQRPEPR
ncbi:MAG: DeoR/GlpR family DNA-binding transcription regulator [Actinomycetales bacterium]